MQTLASVRFRRGDQRSACACAAAALGSFAALGLADGACVSRLETGLPCKFNGRGLAAVLSQVDADADAASRDAGPDPEDAGLDRTDAESESGCVDRSICPNGTVLLMATYSAPCDEKTIVCRRLRPGLPGKPRGPVALDDFRNDSLWLSGDPTREDIQAILAIVARIDAQPPHAIHQHDDAAEVTMECVGDCIMGSGWGYAVRKVDGAWTIVRRLLPNEIE
jgi:hypothetical protein